jgi:hypothetical protein
MIELVSLPDAERPQGASIGVRTAPIAAVQADYSLRCYRSERRLPKGLKRFQCGVTDCQRKNVGQATFALRQEREPAMSMTQDETRWTAPPKS